MTKKRDVIQLIAAIAIIFLALWLRHYRLDAPGLVVDREFRSALLSRAFYFSNNDNIPEWRREVAAASAELEPMLEPPVTEFLAAQLFHLVKNDNLQTVRYLTIFFWFASALFLFALIRDLLSVEAALYSLGYYLLVPLGVLVSRSFQPDPLMMLLFVSSLYFLNLALGQNGYFLFWLAGLVGGMSILHRPLVFFSTVGFALALTLFCSKSIRAFFCRRNLLYFFLLLTPGALFYIYTLLLTDILWWKVESSFLPHLFATRQFWEGWFLTATDSVTGVGLLTALLGVPLIGSGKARWAIIGLSIGYLLFGLAFNFHIHFANYYHLQLLVILALPIGAVLSKVNHFIISSASWRWAWVTNILILLTFTAMTGFSLRDTIIYREYETVEVAKAIGDTVNHSIQVVHISPFYGSQLEFYGDFAGTYWPRALPFWLYQRPGETAKSVEQRLYELPFTPEYFVITNMSAYRDHHADLATYLEQNCQLITAHEQYFIYGNCAR